MGNPDNKTTKAFDVFLSHNAEDKPEVEYLARKLRDEAHLKVWLDKWELPPGSTWLDALEYGLKASKVCVIFLGPHGFGQWQKDEIRAAQVLHKEQPPFYIVPVLLPGSNGETFPIFIRNLIWEDFRNGLDDHEAFERLVCGIQGQPLPLTPLPLASDRCPYKGLQAFEEEDAEFFFGREIFVQQILLEHLRHSRFLAVIGPSGSGKSSVVRAGLVPALRQGKLPEKKPLHVLKLTPGARPLEELAVALLPLVAPNSNRAFELPRLIEQFLSDGKILHFAIRSAFTTSDLQFATCNLLLIDQFEEAFTLCTDVDQRAAFFGNLVYAATLSDSPLTIVLTMRSDFIGKCAAYSDLNMLMSENLVQVPQMNETELRAAIVEPAHKVGLRFDEELVDTILKDIIGAPGNLPLLQDALLELWQRHENGRLLLFTYREIGGVQGSLARHADEVFNQLTPNQQELSRRIFIRLAALGEGTGDTRCRTSKVELLTLGDEAEIVLQKLAGSRLVTTSRDVATGEETVEVTHEALIRGWPRLASWLNDDRAFRRFRERLTEDVREWKRRGRDISDLYRGARLTEAEHYLEIHADELNKEEKEFIQAGLKLRTQELEKQRKSAHRLRWLAVGLAFALLATICIALWANHQRKLALEQRILTDEQRSFADEQRKIAKSRELAAIAWQNPETDPIWILRGALEAVETYATFEAEDALRRALQNIPKRIILREHIDRVNFASFNSDGSRIVTVSDDGAALVWETTSGKELNEFYGHTDKVNHASFNVDGSRIVTASDDSTARVWEVSTGNEVSVLSGHRGGVKQAIFSFDGARIVTVSDDKTVRIWESSTGKELAVLRGHTNGVNYVSFNSDCSRIVTASRDATARVWEVATGKRQIILRGHRSGVNCAHFNGDGNRIVTASDDSTVCLWDINTGKMLTVLRGHTDKVNCANFNRDGSRIVTASDDKTVRIWEAGSGKQLIVLLGHSDAVRQASFSWDGGRIVTASDDGTARLWDTFAGKQLNVLRGHTAKVLNASLNGDGTRIITVSSDKTARIWEIPTYSDPFVLWGHTARILCANFNRDGNRIVTASYDGIVRVWETLTGKELAVLRGHAGGVLNASFNSDGSRIVTAGTDNTARVWDTVSGKMLKILRSHTDWVREANFLKNGHSVVTTSDDGTARLWEIIINGKKSKVVVFRGHTNWVLHVDWNEDESCIVTASYDSTARVWNTTTGKELMVLRGHKNWVRHARFNSDGSRIVTASWDSTARVWDAVTGKALLILRGHTDWVRDANFNRDGSRIVTASRDGTARVWNIATGKELFVLRGHTASVRQASFNLNDTRIITASDDGTVRVWETQTGKLLSILRGHESPVYSATFSPDGRLILTAGEDGTARLYYTYLEDLIKLAKSRLTR